MESISQDRLRKTFEQRFSKDLSDLIFKNLLF